MVATRTPKRPNRRPHALLQGRVAPGIKERAERGAAARGVSLTRYLELLIEADELADTPPAQLDLTA
ncbi:hypothetical protein [Actinomadura terrae]|uniref:hypothetical protein n=1 Tax=Actinomadura terrae TaxID=604353 RepID=UPI001FA77BF2|nr:hypothetical protein [Actinomadura terrae]